jgi:predicted secreted Zn-dependent protease
MAIVERTYPVIGCSVEELRAAVAVFGPVRRGRRFAAYTDWTVSWRYAAADCVVSQIDVEVTGAILLPRWTPLASVSPALVERWKRLVDALRLHERGHAAIGARAAREVRAAIAGVPRQPDLDALHRAVRDAAEKVIGGARRDEAWYDAETRDGALQGAALATLSAI